MDGVTTGLFWNMFKHIRSWLSRLDRARAAKYTVH